MRIGLISVCTMMFMLYGTDCRAEKPNGDADSLQEVKSESFKPVFAKSRRNSLRNEKRRELKKSKQDVSDSQEPEEEKFYDAVDPEYNAWLEKKNRDEKNSAESKENKDPWHRDGRSYADVVKGIKKQDETNKEESSKLDQIGDEKNNSADNWIKDQKDYRLKKNWKNKSYGRWENEPADGSEKIDQSKEKKAVSDSSDNWIKDQKDYQLKNNWKNKSYGRWESEPIKGSDEVDQSADKSKEKAISDPEDQDKSEKTQSTEKKRNKIAQPGTNRSKKAYEARRAREKAAGQDEFSEKWKSANKNSTYRRK